MAELSDDDKQKVIAFHTWVKEHPEFREVLREQVNARTLMLRSKFATFSFPIKTLGAIAEYGNEEFMLGYYIASTRK
jgi:hypothetical protein